MKKILIVDDDPDIVYSIKRGLESLGEEYEMVGANGGKDAIQKLEEFTPDLILLDIMMPDMNGWDVVAKVRERSDLKTIPIVFLTAKDDAISKGMASLGVDDYIVKPVEIHELNNRLRKILKV